MQAATARLKTSASFIAFCWVVAQRLHSWRSCRSAAADGSAVTVRTARAAASGMSYSGIMLSTLHGWETNICGSPPQRLLNATASTRNLPTFHSTLASGLLRLRKEMG